MLKLSIKEGPKSVCIKICTGSNKSTKVRSYKRIRNGKVEHVKGYIRKN